jgi:hypothetical protein
LSTTLHGIVTAGVRGCMATTKRRRRRRRRRRRKRTKPE